MNFSRSAKVQKNPHSNYSCVKFARSNESVTLLIGHVVPNSRDDKRGTSDKSDIHGNDKRNVSQTLRSFPYFRVLSPSSILSANFSPLLIYNPVHRGSRFLVIIHFPVTFARLFALACISWLLAVSRAVTLPMKSEGFPSEGLKNSNVTVCIVAVCRRSRVTFKTRLGRRKFWRD